MAFARWLFWIAGSYGLIALLPQYFLAHKVGTDFPPAITHVEYFYGFLGIAVAWQMAFLIIGWDPWRFRPVMIPSALEKLSFAAATSVLYGQGRLATVVFVAGLIDLALGVSFLIAWWHLRHQPVP